MRIKMTTCILFITCNHFRFQTILTNFFYLQEQHPNVARTFEKSFNTTFVQYNLFVNIRLNVIFLKVRTFPFSIGSYKERYLQM